MKNPEPSVSVVIATRNRAARLRAALESLRTQTLASERLEVIVVDDGSTDGTAELLAAEAATGDLQLRAVTASGCGPGAARNDGWRLARAPLIAFTDDDCVASPGWAQAGLEAWGREPLRFVQGATAPIQEELDGFSPLSYTYDISTLGPAFETCNMFYPRALLERLGGFDSDAFQGPQGEDTDLAWRARRFGAEPVFAADARVFHAVFTLGRVAFLRRCWSWQHALPALARHPELRRARLHYRLFWNVEHYHLGKAVLALLLPRRRALWPLKAWLVRGYLEKRYIRPRASARSIGLVGWFLLTDCVEIASMLVGSLRYRTLVL